MVARSKSFSQFCVFPRPNFKRDSEIISLIFKIEWCYRNFILPNSLSLESISRASKILINNNDNNNSKFKVLQIVMSLNIE